MISFASHSVATFQGQTRDITRNDEAGFIMQQLATGYKGLGLLFDVNNDRLLSIVIIAVALAAVGWVGVEYANSVIVESAPATSTTFL
jgi:hypothetical protein